MRCIGTRPQRGARAGNYCPVSSSDTSKSASSGVAARVSWLYGARMRIAIASDHAATDLKAELAEWLMDEGHEVADLGPDAGESVDYPDYGYKLASVVADGR